jgi:hypothetical protein
VDTEVNSVNRTEEFSVKVGNSKVVKITYNNEKFGTSTFKFESSHPEIVEVVDEMIEIQESE